MTPAERRDLKQIEAQNAHTRRRYRETLASRLTATHVVKNQSERWSDEPPDESSRDFQGTARDTLREDLRADLAGLSARCASSESRR